MQDATQQFVFNVMKKNAVAQWDYLEIECRKGMTYTRRQHKKAGTTFQPGISKSLFDQMKKPFEEHFGAGVEQCVYDVFIDNNRISIDATSGQQIQTIMKKGLDKLDEGYLRVSAALEMRSPPPNNIMNMFRCIHPWQSMCQGIPVRLTQQYTIEQGICADDDPLLNTQTNPQMLWILYGYSTLTPDFIKQPPPSTVRLECLPGRVDNHFYPQGAYVITAFPKMTVAVSPFARGKMLPVSNIRKKKRTAFELRPGIEMHFTETRQHLFSLVELEFQPIVYEVEFEYMLRDAIVSKFFPRSHASIHFIIDEYVPQFVAHITNRIPSAHIHVFADTDFGKDVVQIFMQDGDVACVHCPHFLIGETDVFVKELHFRKCRLISKMTTLYHRTHLTSGTRFKETADGRFVDLRTMKPVNKKKYEKEQKQKRKRVSYYNIEGVEHVAHNTSVYTLKNHFNYIPPFGFQMAEQFARDIHHIFQKVFPL